jgi:endo-1,4-beta-mannosidase
VTEPSVLPASPDRESAVIGEPFVLGVNYWPRRKAMTWWADFDAGEVREEFETIADIGMTMVRIFLLWEHWQPAPDAVDEAALANSAFSQILLTIWGSSST